jgi:hypothetical protein
MTFSLGTTNDEFPPRETELLRRLTEIAKQRGFDDPVACATVTTRKILRAIRRKRSDKLNSWHYEKFKEQRDKAEWKQHSQSEEYIQWVAHLVRLESNKLQRFNRDDVIKDATSGTVADLNPVEKLAAELLCGRKRKPRKNSLEKRAEQLAKAVQRDWFSPIKRIGRHPGTDSRKGIAEGNWYDVPLSASEVIDAAMPVIDELAGNKISGLRGLVAAVHTIASGTSPESIARMASRIRARVRQTRLL